MKKYNLSDFKKALRRMGATAIVDENELVVESLGQDDFHVYGVCKGYLVSSVSQRKAYTAYYLTTRGFNLVKKIQQSIEKSIK